MKEEKLLLLNEIFSYVSGVINLTFKGLCS